MARSRRCRGHRNRQGQLFLLAALISDSLITPWYFAYDPNGFHQHSIQFCFGQNLLGLKIKTTLREGGLFWLTCRCISAHVALAIPSSKQKGPDLLGEK